MMTDTSPACSGAGDKYDVCVVGAGPAGLMLGAVLSRLGIKTTVLDERPDRTAVGRADGIQPKTIETFQMMGLGDELLRDGVRVHDICMWRGGRGGNGEAEPLHRVSREVHYPADCLDVLQPFILLCHQGMIEGLLLDDLHDSGSCVRRSHVFESFAQGADRTLTVHSRSPSAAELPTVQADYVVGCDGARSRVRAQIPDTYAQGTPHRSTWGVLDGELDTDFPDIWSKTVVFSEEHGTVLMIPRERNMTRFYIEMKVEEEEDEPSKGKPGARATAAATSTAQTQERVMEQARRVLAPFRLGWRTVEWFGHYTVAQRVAARFADPTLRVFIGGDASHTHSPKAAQGMNTSVHDSWNLAWKLNLAVRGLATPALLASYEAERKKIGLDLIHFDYEHANQIAGGDAQALAANFRTNIRFIAGVGVDYGLNAINEPVRETRPSKSSQSGGLAQPGCTLPPAKATRYIDANPVDVQLDIPILGQFRVYVFVPDVVAPAQAAFLRALSQAVCADSSVLAGLSAAAKASYAEQPRPSRKKDVFVRPERYTTVSELFTFALMTATDKNKFEISQLPPLFASSAWTVYLDDVPSMDTQGKTCTGKWLGGLTADEVAVMNVRPDGYVGSIRRWKASGETGVEAARWLDAYYGGFLQAP